MIGIFLNRKNTKFSKKTQKSSKTNPLSGILYLYHILMIKKKRLPPYKTVCIFFNTASTLIVYSLSEYTEKHKLHANKSGAIFFLSSESD